MEHFDIPIDIKVACEAVGADIDIYSEIIDVFMGDWQKRFLVLADATRKNETPLISSTAHSLKGACASIGAVEAMRTASLIEIRAKTGETDQLDKNVDELRHKIEKVEAYFKRENWQAEVEKAMNCFKKQ